MSAGAERQIVEEIASAGGASIAKLGLRFDRVVIRVLGDLRRFAERGLRGKPLRGDSGPKAGSHRKAS